MRLVIAIIQPHRLDALKMALTEVEIFRLTVADVQGYGRQRGHTQFFEGTAKEVNLIRKVRVEIAVNDAMLTATLRAITKGARSGDGAMGHAGDGKIFVMPLENVIRISDGVEGMEAI